MLIDGSGRHHPVHSGLLRLFFPVFRGLKIEELKVVVLDKVTTEEAQFVLELAYGMGRCAIFMILKFPDEIYTSAIWSSIKDIFATTT